MGHMAGERVRDAPGLRLCPWGRAVFQGARSVSGNRRVAGLASGRRRHGGNRGLRGARAAPAGARRGPHEWPGGLGRLGAGGTGVLSKRGHAAAPCYPHRDLPAACSASLARTFEGWRGPRSVARDPPGRSWVRHVPESARGSHQAPPFSRCRPCHRRGGAPDGISTARNQA